MTLNVIRNIQFNGIINYSFLDISFNNVFPNNLPKYYVCNAFIYGYNI